MATLATRRRPAFQLGALTALTALALTGCSSGPENGGDSASGEATQQATASATAEQSAGAESDAAGLQAEAGTCFTSEPGIRDLANFTETDCEGEHTAEYLWAVPADAAEGDVDTEGVCRGLAEEYGADLEVTVTATELRDSSDMSQHCVLYTITDPWTGQVVDPEITLEKAAEQA